MVGVMVVVWWLLRVWLLWIFLLILMSDICEKSFKVVVLVMMFELMWLILIMMRCGVIDMGVIFLLMFIVLCGILLFLIVRCGGEFVCFCLVCIVMNWNRVVVVGNVVSLVFYDSV